MALTLRRHHTYEYGAFREMLELHAPYSIIREYIPGILNYIVQPGSSRRPLQIDITSVLRAGALIKVRIHSKECIQALPKCSPRPTPRPPVLSSSIYWRKGGSTKAWKSSGKRYRVRERGGSTSIARVERSTFIYRGSRRGGS
ncbi:hypothetical protein CISG_06725 [Coccidioides immitis RMSCC 3703]|uniref:Uncharacterized protein n=1 Tax=Coccidioides immitis RMSCC 3703 TaxID=454286 RepID=A0A0J8TVH9_COCIT|nr:hypothetical protein CISG_06725 [Coccidioides immitis RMSCC 3703]